MDVAVVVFVTKWVSWIVTRRTFVGRTQRLRWNLYYRNKKGGGREFLCCLVCRRLVVEEENMPPTREIEVRYVYFLASLADDEYVRKEKLTVGTKK